MQPEIIKLPIRSLEALLDTTGSPVVADHIHPDAAKWLYALASERPPARGYRVIINAPTNDVPTSAVADAVRGHFAADAQQCRRELGYEMRGGFRMLGLALIIVAGLMLLAEVLSSFGRFHHQFFSQSLIIISWVTLWRPAERLLYEPILLRRRRNILEALARAEVEVVHPSEN